MGEHVTGILLLLVNLIVGDRRKVVDELDKL